jgi:hypothetical protein
MTFGFGPERAAQKLGIVLLLSAVLVSWTTSAEAVTGLRRYTEVVGGVFRAGGPGGQVALPASTLQELCEKGFTQALYLYPSAGCKTCGTYTCTANGRPNQLVYRGMSFNKSSTMLQALMPSVLGQTGSTLFHCWNGVHATGQVASLARIQFCGWSNQDAADYFLKALGKSFGGLLDYERAAHAKIMNYKPDPSLAIPASAQSRVCP